MNHRRKLLRVVSGAGIPLLIVAILLSFTTLRSGAATTVTQLFFDDFNGSSLDTSRWTIVEGGGSIQVTGGLLQTVGGPDHKEINSIPTFAPMGQSIVAKARIRLAGQYHKFGFNVNACCAPLGPGTGFYFDTYDDRDGNIENTIRALVWFLPTSGAPVSLLDVTVPVTWYEFHEFAIDWRATEVIFLIDNVEVARVAVTFGGALPVGVWNDRPSLMQTDWVEVNQVILNTPPTAVCQDVVVATGSNCTANASINSGSFDPDGDSITISQSPPGPYPIGATLVTLTVTDSKGASSQCAATVTVNNPSPTVTITGPPSGAIYPIGASVNFTGAFADNPGAHTANWMFGSVTLAGTVNESTGQVSATHSFTAPGVYKVKLTVDDGCGGTGVATTVGGLDAMVVIYDPDGSFVIGGGWINSPAGAYPANPSLTGKAIFGFVSKYKQGAAVPIGQTVFQFKAAGLNFKSESYDWLVVASARAQYKGSGTINGGGNYGFLLTAIDGKINGGGGVDKFRIKIWDKGTGDVVYDTQIGADDGAAPNTALGGGSIVIHK